jgi:hypothetical protein
VLKSFPSESSSLNTILPDGGGVEEEGVSSRSGMKIGLEVDLVFGGEVESRSTRFLGRIPSFANKLISFVRRCGK